MECVGGDVNCGAATLPYTAYRTISASSRVIVRARASSFSAGMREKTVAFFYTECVSAQGATPADLTYVRELAGATAAALATSIRLKKKQVI
jgi:hypothetical protein